MISKRKQHVPALKLRVALEALKGLKTVSELASQYQVHPTQIQQWKKQFKEGGREIFRSPGVLMVLSSTPSQPPEVRVSPPALW